MTHTISPWVVADDFIGIYDEQGRCLADMDSEGAPYVDYDESLANAHLMAAAPDLLAALQAISDVINDVMKDDDCDSSTTIGGYIFGDIMDGAMHFAKIAIAKAKGKWS